MTSPYEPGNYPDAADSDPWSVPESPQDAQQSQPQQPQAPKPRNNTGLVATATVLGLVLAGLVGVGGGYLLSQDSKSAAPEPSPVAAGQTSSSQSPQAEAGRGSDMPIATPGKSIPVPERAESSTQETSPAQQAPGNFGQRAFKMNRSDIDAAGWIGSTARCSGGFYARVLAETPSGKVVICENSSNRQDRHYIGDFQNISAAPDTYPVENFSAERVIATNEGYRYELTRSDLKVFKGGEQVFSEPVTDWGLLQAG